MEKYKGIRTTFTLILLDIAFWAMSISILMSWRIIADKQIITRYFFSFIVFAAIWIFVGACIKKYKSWKGYSIKKLHYTFLITSLITICCTIFYHRFVYPDLSISVFIVSVLYTVCFNFIVLASYSAYRYAAYWSVDDYKLCDTREPQKVLNPPFELKEEQYDQLKALICENSSDKIFKILQENLPLRSTNTLTIKYSTHFDVKMLQSFRYDCIINILPLNSISSVNQFLCAVNEKLPDDGLWCCTYFTQEFYQLEILKNNPKFFRWILYFLNIFLHRIIPQLLFIRRFYFKQQRKKKRFFSTTEIIGRLYYCGFKVEQEMMVDNQNFIFARRNCEPHDQQEKFYGLIIKLPRIGKNGKIFNVYKYRTMYPYAEYMQEYIYEQNNIAEGGKIKNDLRITPLGRLMRKYWIDELPMFINLIKGEIKFVGVRPLSKHYFSLYSKELQEKRIKFKPGLLPPFYADMPKTIEEIQASEMKYLKECETKGVFKTDFKYFWKILANIILKNARSR